MRTVQWWQELDTLKQRLGAVFGRRELRASASAFLDGLLSGVERKTGWLMAEQAGLESPYRMQSLLGRSQWDADKLRDVVRTYATEALGDEDGVLVVDETGFLKKAHTRSASHDNIRARLDVLRTARSASFLPMQAVLVKP